MDPDREVGRIFLGAFIIIPLLTLVERKVLGRPIALRAEQGRPVRALQPAADAVKLLSKEGFRPATAVPILSDIAPALVVVSAVATLAIIPFGNAKDGVGFYGIDVPIGVLYFFAFGSPSFWAAARGGRPEVQLPRRDALRGTADLVRGLDGLALLGPIMMAGTLSLVGLVEAQGEVWYIVPQIVGFLIFTLAGFAEATEPVRPPGGRRRAGSGLPDRIRRDALRLVRIGRRVLRDVRDLGISAAFFLGGWMGPGPGWLDPIWMVVKILTLVLVFMGAGDAAAAALRPADVARLEGAASACDAQRPGDRDPGDGALMQGPS